MLRVAAMKLLRSFLVGMIATAITITLTFVVAVFLPGPAVTTSGSVDKEKIRAGQIYSREEIEKFEREMKERITKVDKESVHMTPKYLFTLVRRNYWWCTWIPWLLLPFLVKFKPRSIEPLLIILPVVAVALFGWVLPIEVGASVAALLIGMVIKSLIGRASA